MGYNYEGIRTKAKRALSRVFHFEGYHNDDQEEAIETILFRKNRKNFIINMASLSGKSLCYQLPGYLAEGITIVILPSLALIKDQVKYLRSLDIGVATINSNVDYIERDEIKLNLISGNSIKFLLLTPEMAKIQEDFLQILILEQRVNYIVVDEAHKVIDAADYRDFSVLREFRSISAEVVWIALTACDLPTQESIANMLNMENALFFSRSRVRQNITYDSVESINAQDKTIKDFLDELSDGEHIPKTIIFCMTIFDINRMNNHLRKQNLPFTQYHGWLPLDIREENFESWVNRKEVPIMIATGESFGFGMHYQMPFVRCVIHFGMPKNLRKLYHESSLAGNDGENEGFSRVYLNNFTKTNFDQYHNAFCKRQFLATFFGEEIEPCENRCDACLARY